MENEALTLGNFNGPFSSNNAFDSQFQCQKSKFSLRFCSCGMLFLTYLKMLIMENHERGAIMRMPV
jgi:hypothetical protein